jgi:hypothetical protein
MDSRSGIDQITLYSASFFYLEGLAGLKETAKIDEKEH